MTGDERGVEGYTTRDDQKDRHCFQTMYNIEYFIKKIRNDLKELIGIQRNFGTI